MIIKVKEKGYVSPPYKVPELTVFYDGKKVENITLSIDKKTIEIGEPIEEQSEVEFNLFKKGIQGTQGTSGNNGLQGKQGTQGNSGNNGIQGAQGIQGNYGIQGAQGIQGNYGIQGSQGIQGPIGTFNVTDMSKLTPLINMNIQTDGNYLYVRVGDKIKRIPLSDFN